MFRCHHDIINLLHLACYALSCLSITCICKNCSIKGMFFATLNQISGPLNLMKQKFTSIDFDPCCLLLFFEVDTGCHHDLHWLQQKTQSLVGF